MKSKSALHGGAGIELKIRDIDAPVHTLVYTLNVHF